ncbi:type II secretion system protein [Pseudomaricurvus alkylphenolicus]|jgi:MSHA pilin protein MshD|uniref:type IV pilus modification PilV family protein n=1 Tax=Pseudomaricurvus alkylphenolicus TaxID=1306991 RepID=UPI00141D94C8|nr:type II secretion system protein [Pseudomaricurvus alkylphenolicus]NIB44394.1 type II secretion system protein [Pseudomaricurvus alkylphenolicus]
MSSLSNIRGVTLIELLVFVVVIGTATTALFSVFNVTMANNVDPMIRVRLQELAQSQLDEILARKYNENTPTGGIPACGSGEVGALACTGIGTDGGEAGVGDYDDVDDFHLFADTPFPGYNRSVSVTEGGTDIGLAVGQAKRITVTVTAPAGESVQLSAYRANF